MTKWYGRAISLPLAKLSAVDQQYVKSRLTSYSSAKNSLPPSLREGLIAYYPFNGNANDESGNGNDPEVQGAALTADRHGKDAATYRFDGESHISVLVKNLPVENSARTVTCWFKTHPAWLTSRFVSSRTDFIRKTMVSMDCCMAGLPLTAHRTLVN